MDGAPMVAYETYGQWMAGDENTRGFENPKIQSDVTPSVRLKRASQNRKIAIVIDGGRRKQISLPPGLYLLVFVGRRRRPIGPDRGSH